MQVPSIEKWLAEAKADENAPHCGMYLIHNGTVRTDSKAKVRLGEKDTLPVAGMMFSYDREKAALAVERAKAMRGIYYARVWLNEGMLEPGDDIMLVLIGGDTRPNVVAALQSLVDELKNNCVSEKEVFRN